LIPCNQRNPIHQRFCLFCLHHGLNGLSDFADFRFMCPRIKPMRFRYTRQTNLIGFFVLVDVQMLLVGEHQQRRPFFVCITDDSD